MVGSSSFDVNYSLQEAEMEEKEEEVIKAFKEGEGFEVSNFVFAIGM